MHKAEIENAVNSILPDQTAVFRQMAGERGLDYDSLTNEQYKALIIEEAEWCDQFAAHPATDEQERQDNREYAHKLREVAAAI